MNTAAEKRLTIIAFRAVGILIILIGLILTTHTIISLMAVSSLKSNMPGGMNINIKGPVGTMGAWAILAQLFTSAWGAAVFVLAERLAGFILPETTQTAATTPDS
mgnify:CR=1 FL=1